MTEAKDSNVFNLCEKIIEDGKLTYDEVYDLSELVNQTINKYDDQLVKWPTNLLIKPLQEVWKDGALDIEELNIIAELLVSIVYNSELENVNKKNGTKTCPHCSRVLMSSLIPRCSWCGKKIKETEMYSHSKDWLKNKKIDDAWEEVLSEKKLSCFNKWFGRLYNCPVKESRRLNRRGSWFND